MSDRSNDPMERVDAPNAVGTKAVPPVDVLVTAE
jgi:hypothetical protein